MSVVRNKLDSKFYKFLVDNHIFFHNPDYKKILLFIKREKVDSYNRGWNTGIKKAIKKVK